MLQDHGHGASASSGAPVYIPAVTGAELLLDDRSTWVCAACPRLLPDSAMVRNRTHNYWVVKSNALTITLQSHPNYKLSVMICDLEMPYGPLLTTQGITVDKMTQTKLTTTCQAQWHIRTHIKMHYIAWNVLPDVSCNTKQYIIYNFSTFQERYYTCWTVLHMSHQ